MSKFKVKVLEIVYVEHEVLIEADTENEALDKYFNGQYDPNIRKSDCFDGDDINTIAIKVE